jgi:hypothetical protein
MEPTELKEQTEQIAEGPGENWLNRAIAVAVVICAVFMALCKVKDDNIVQAMQASQVDKLDNWSYYQANSIKGHMYEIQIDEWELKLKSSDPTLGPAVRAEAEKKIAKWKSDIAKYDKGKDDTKKKAEDAAKDYDKFNYRDDQFDLSDTMMGLAVALFALASLVRSRAVFGIAVAIAGFGILMGLSGFYQWHIHPDAVTKFLS